MRILITGGAGFIGTNLAVIAEKRGHHVSVYDNFSTGYRANTSHHGASVVEGDIRDYAKLTGALKGVDACVHLAALGSVPRSVADPVSTHESNASGTLNVLLACRDSDVGQVLTASSSSVYGLNPALPKEERNWVRPLSPYGVSKLAAEQYTLAFQQSYGMATLAFRFFNVYGPHQMAGHDYAAVIPRFVDAILRGQPLVVNGDGRQSRDFTYVETLCDVLLQAIEGVRSHPEPINLAFGSETTLLGLISRIEVIAGRKAIIEHSEERKGDVRHSRANNQSLRSLFPAVEAVELDRGLESTIEWFRRELK